MPNIPSRVDAGGPVHENIRRGPRTQDFILFQTAAVVFLAELRRVTSWWRPYVPYSKPEFIFYFSRGRLLNKIALEGMGMMKKVLFMYIHTTSRAILYLPCGRPVPFHSIPFAFRSVPFNSVPLYYVPLHSIPFRSVRFHSIPLHSVAFRSVPFRSVPFRSVPFRSVPFLRLLVIVRL